MTGVVSLAAFTDSLVSALARARTRASDRRDVYAARIYGEAIDLVHETLAEEKRYPDPKVEESV